MSNTENQSHQSHEADNNYERQDANPWLLGGALAIGMVLLGISLVLINDYFTLEKEKMMLEVAMKPESSLLRDIRAREEHLLNSYGIVDSSAGIYRIPIEQAMKLQAEEAYASK